MSNQSAPLSDGEPLFLAPVMPAGALPPPAAHHPQPEPSAYMCTCGKVREACVHDEVRALWSSVSTK
jgi:hypothetical protein